VPFLPPDPVEDVAEAELREQRAADIKAIRDTALRSATLYKMRNGYDPAWALLHCIGTDDTLAGMVLDWSS